MGSPVLDNRYGMKENSTGFEKGFDGNFYPRMARSVPIPVTFLIDKLGIVREVQRGRFDNAKQIEQIVQKYV